MMHIQMSQMIRFYKLFDLICNLFQNQWDIYPKYPISQPISLNQFLTRSTVPIYVAEYTKAPYGSSSINSSVKLATTSNRKNDPSSLVKSAKIQK